MTVQIGIKTNEGICLASDTNEEYTYPFLCKDIYYRRNTPKICLDSRLHYAVGIEGNYKGPNEKTLKRVIGYYRENPDMLKEEIKSDNVKSLMDILSNFESDDKAVYLNNQVTLATNYDKTLHLYIGKFGIPKMELDEEKRGFVGIGPLEVRDFIHKNLTPDITLSKAKEISFQAINLASKLHESVSGFDMVVVERKRIYRVK